MPAWIAGIQARKDAFGDVHVNLDSSTPCWNDGSKRLLELTEISSPHFGVHLAVAERGKKNRAGRAVSFKSAVVRSDKPRQTGGSFTAGQSRTKLDDRYSACSKTVITPPLGRLLSPSIPCARAFPMSCLGERPRSSYRRRRAHIRGYRTRFLQRCR